MSNKKKPVYKPNYPICRVIGGKSQKQIEEENAVFEKQEQAQKQKAIEDGIARAQQFKNETAGIFRFARAVRYRNQQHENLAEYRNKPHTELQAIYTEFIDLSQRRGLPLSNEDIDFGRLYLEQLLSQPQRPQPVESKNLAQRLKEAVTSFT